MYPFQRILRALRAWLQPRRSYELDADTLQALRTIAEIERSTPQAIAGQLLADALQRQEMRQSSMRLWQALSPREQEVTALVCLQYTNREIALRLHISPQTVKTHVAHILTKLGLPSRNALRDVLSNLDFGQWEQ
jgi:DNA-binding NarL/FixJ family response regulator